MAVAFVIAGAISTGCYLLGGGFKCSAHLLRLRSAIHIEPVAPPVFTEAWQTFAKLRLPPSNKSVNADAQSRSAAAPRRSLVAGYVRRYEAWR